MSEPLVLRDYQLQGVEQLREGVRDGHTSQVLVAPTGAGKTAVAAHLLSESARKFSRACIVVDRVSLCDQTSAVLDRYGIAHGVIQADHWRRRGYERVQVASAQTLEKRGFGVDNLDLLIVDECHCVRRQTADFIKSRGDTKVVGLTATPFSPGMDQLYTNVVNVTTTDALIEQGWLVPVKQYVAVAPDMTGAKTVAGEWTDSEIEARGTKIVGDIVAEWQAKTQQHFGGPAKTLVFAASVAHGAELARAFQVAGFNFVQISYRDTNDEERRAIIEEFRKPDSRIVGLISCEILTKGFDVPDVLVGIGARPYRASLSSHIQQLGRVMRPAPGKQFALWLDHAGNLMRFWHDTHEVWANGVKRLNPGGLDKPVREPEKKVLQDIVCRCGMALQPGWLTCPGCGAERRRRSMEEVEAGTMIEVASRHDVTGKQLPPLLANREHVWNQLMGMALGRKHGDEKAAARFASVQYRSLYGTWPPFAFNAVHATDPDVKLHAKVMRNIIAWAREQDAKRQREREAA